MEYHIPLAVMIGFFLDLLWGDPHFIYHPVQLIGQMIVLLEKWIRKLLPKTNVGERIGGGLLVLFVLCFCFLIPALILYLAFHLSFLLFFVIECLFSYQILAMKSLKMESMKVYDQLEKEDVIGARKAVSMIVGRDTNQLNAEQITKATVETIAENASDGVIAPLFFLMIAGPIGGFLYKGINTMDSMVGYKNTQYQYFGTAAAKLDDLVNYVPARIGGLFMGLMAYVCGLDGKEALRIFFRDRKNHASPNSAQTEAAMAGALGVQLAGDAVYFGKRFEKPTIGDDSRKIEIKDIVRANRLLYATGFFSMVLFFALTVFGRWMTHLNLYIG